MWFTGEVTTAFVVIPSVNVNQWGHKLHEADVEKETSGVIK